MGHEFHDPQLAELAALAERCGATMASKMDELIDALDHPIFFLFVISIGVVCFLSIMAWGAKAAGLPGPAMLLQHP